jgi:alkaline phosphatase D
MPGVVRGGRPQVTHGVMSGDVGERSGAVWARADRASRMIVEIAATESFAGARRIDGPIATADGDYTAQVDLRGLPAGQDVLYRVRFADLDDPTLTSEPVTGRFRTPPGAGRDVSFVWSGDTAGQGWGINPAFGGMRIYETMRARRPDFFIHSGDTVYADGPLQPSVTLPDGTVWTNVVTPEKSKVAETLDEFRGQHRYNLLDANVRAFNAEVPMFAQWDDHEVTNNWYPGEILDLPQYTEKNVDVLADRAAQAFAEYMPIRETPFSNTRIFRKVSYGPLLDVFFLDLRSFRDPNSANVQPGRSAETALMGRRQLAWLKAALASSRARWKAIASDMPIGLVVPDGATAFEGIANRDDGPALGRELEIADLLSFVHRRGIANVVWFTADVHYTAAHEYSPDRAAFQDFTPFWEFVSGPLNAGTFGPNALDATFGPRVAFQRVPDGGAVNLPPSAGLQFFGHTAIAADTGVMTVSLVDIAGTTLWSTDLTPA